MVDTSSQIRLQKVIARSGIASRRKAEALIREGQVTVNGKTISVLGTCIDPKRDHVKVSGRHIKPAQPDVFLLLNKPAGCISTMKDPLGRPTVADLLDKISIRTFPVGRLDYDSEGLLLLTNNGLVAQACLHPQYHVPKTYLAKIKGVLTNEEVKQLKQGVLLDDGPTAPARVRKIRIAEANSWVELTIHEGRNHQVKRMLEAVGHLVIKLKRTKFGPLALGDLPLGECRYLTDKEANALRALPHRPLLSSEKNSTRQPSKTSKATRKPTNRRTQPRLSSITKKKQQR